MLVVVLVVIAIIGSYLYVDRSVVFWLAAHHSRDLTWIAALANWPVSVMMVAVPLMYMAGAVAFYTDRFTWQWQRILLVFHSTVIAYAMDHFFKFVFARTWSATFTCNNISLLRDRVYGFHWFNAGVAYGSFPSGHTAWTAAAMYALGVLYPKCRYICGLVLFAVVFGQLAMYYHFVSDVLAGLFVGVGTAKVCLAISEAYVSRLDPGPRE